MKIREDEALKSVLQELGPKYEYKKFLGQGSFSKVYLLHHKILRQNRALKIMDSNYILQTLEKGNARDVPQKFALIKKRFINEARVYSKIDHPNVVRIYDVESIEDKNEGIDITYILMQFVEGKSLKNILDENSPLEMDRVMAVSKDILHAVRSLHEVSIVHRDIKPANIIIEKESNRAILIDFGLAKDIKDLSESTAVAEADRSLGTPVYMSPDQFQIHSKIGPAVDLYAFGVLLYEMLAGEVPYKGTLAEIIKGHLLTPIPDVREKNPLAPAGFRGIMKKALAKEPKNRYSRAEDLLVDLEKIEKSLAAEKAAKAKAKEKKDNLTAVRTGRPKRKIRKYFLYLFGILAVLAAAAVIYMSIFSSNGNNEPGYKEYLENAKLYYEKGELDKAYYNLNEARKIKNSSEINDLSSKIEASRHQPAVEKASGELEDLLGGNAGLDTKIAECLKFLDKYGDIPQNDVTKPLISQVQNFLKKYKEYVKHTTDAEEYVKNGEFQKAYESVKMAKTEAKKIEDQSGTQKTAELENEIYAGCVSAAEAYCKDANPLEAEGNLSIAKTIKPGSSLQYLEKKIRFIKSMPGDVRAVYKTGKEIKKNDRKYWEAEFRDDIVLVFIPAGKFIFSGIGRSVLSGYWLGKYEVSVSQYKKFARRNPSHKPEWLEKGNPVNVETGSDDYYKNRVDDQYPVMGISWDDAAAYCKWLSRKTGLNFKLPEEEKWEKAARGTDGRLYPWGAGRPGNNLANFFSPSRKTVKVDVYPRGASPYGLLNMAGNVEEWCDGGASPGKENNRAARGGSFYSNDRYIRCTSRKTYDREERNHALGFRLCLMPSK
ncbi:MAG: SUMF1/EgtB/PvdO family nonheme iron enzyme [Candidatus Aminicenantes bacterium]|nr:SUMF1/EgtB/PvdO family nonheme iron enzyme [Candidatus Aminicenantes bacterium]